MTHIFQGSFRHSADGIMTPRWGRHDFAAMKRRPLTFTETDLRLIRRRISAVRKSLPLIRIRKLIRSGKLRHAAVYIEASTGRSFR
jgi:hypothetical protein